MSCLCRKLQTSQYHLINETESEILKRSWIEAPQLFQANSRTPCPIVQTKGKRTASDVEPRPRKHLRTFSGSFPQSPTSGQPRDQPSEIIPSLSHCAAELEKTYVYENAARVFEENRLDVSQANDIRQANDTRSIFIRLFIAIERTDDQIEIQQLFRRICCYAFAQLHKKGTSVDPIIHEIDNALPRSKGTRTRIYNILRVGSKWISIVEQFASIVSGAPQQLTGLMCLLGSVSTWERAATEDQQSALTNLHKKTKIHEEVLRVTPFIDKTLKQIRFECSFIDETRTLTSHPNTPLTMPIFQSSQNSLNTSGRLIRRNLHTESEAQLVWKAPSLTAVAEAVPGSSGIYSEDANILLIILAFFSTSHAIPLDLLLRGATPRKRWTRQGEIEEVNAICVGLVPELGLLLSDMSRLAKAFQELELSLSVISDSVNSYTVNEYVASCIRENLSAEHLSFWRSQALIVAYRAIPWKYLEPAFPNPNPFFPHLKQALQAYQDCFTTLSVSTRADLVLSLAEASRFPNMAWKRFTIGQAEVAARDIPDPHLHSCIAQSQSLLGRIAGNMEQAVSCLGNLSQGTLSSTMDKRMHSAIGQATIQRSLNCIQIEDITGAKRSLEKWNPLSQPSPMEEAVLFRKNMMLGRLLRFEGEFAESLAHLERARKTVEEHRVLTFDEDLRDLTCDLADTLRELDDPVSAERHLRTEIMRLDRNQTYSPGQSLVDLSLSEALFAQDRFEEAERVCLDVQSRSNLLKFEILRLHIVRAKLCHVQLDYEGALSCWNEALKAIGKFHMTNGHSTRIIVISICHTLSRLGHTWLAGESLKQANHLDTLAEPGGIRYWIAGMRHWLAYLQHRGRHSRM